MGRELLVTLKNLEGATEAVSALQARLGSGPISETVSQAVNNLKQAHASLALFNDMITPPAPSTDTLSSEE